MIKKVFTIYDEKSEAYLQPFFLDTNGQAIRAITDCVNDVNHQFYRHPSDYSLFRLGTFDDSTAIFSGTTVPMGNLVEFIDKDIQKKSLESMEFPSIADLSQATAEAVKIGGSK